MPKVEKAPEGLKEKMLEALTVAVKSEEEKQLQSSPEETPTGLDAISNSEKITAILQEKGIDTTKLKIEVNNADVPIPDGNGQGGTNYANTEVKIYEDGKLVLEENFQGPEVGGW